MTTHELVSRVKTLDMTKGTLQIEKYVRELMSAELSHDPIGRLRMKRLLKRLLANRD